MRRLGNNRLGMKIAGLMVMMGMLSACSHQNPLTKEKDASSLNYAAIFLYSTAKAAQPAINQKFQMNKERGIFYDDCMDGETTNTEACQALYKGMVDYAVSQSASPYRTVTVKDISDQTMWGMLNGYFNAKQGNDVFLPVK